MHTAQVTSCTMTYICACIRQIHTYMYVYRYMHYVYDLMYSHIYTYIIQPRGCLVAMLYILYTNAAVAESG